MELQRGIFRGSSNNGTPSDGCGCNELKPSLEKSRRFSVRMHLQADLSFTEVGRALKISTSALGKYASLVRVAGDDWAVAQTLIGEMLEARLYQPALPRSSHSLAPSRTSARSSSVPASP
jgi:hypothetical protein